MISSPHVAECHVLFPGVGQFVPLHDGAVHAVQHAEAPGNRQIGLFAVAVVLVAEGQPLGDDGGVKLGREMPRRKSVGLRRPVLQDNSLLKGFIEVVSRADDQGSRVNDAGGA